MFVPPQTTPLARMLNSPPNVQYISQLQALFSLINGRFTIVLGSLISLSLDTPHFDSKFGL